MKPTPRALSLIFFFLVSLALSPIRGADRPNILFIIADDASRHFTEAYGCDWVKTPHIDRLAREGLVFDNAYVPTSKCAPCRAGIMTGRNPWQLGAAANHQPIFPPEIVTFGEAMRSAGIHTGSAGKTWGPGISNDAAGNKRDFGLPAATGKGTPGEKLTAHLKARPKDAPFFFWYGSSDPHRGYELGSGVAAGKKPTDIDHVPAYWPDNETVRSDMLDYAIEIESFDRQVGELLATLDEAGLTDNTLVIVTSDHGMPFPRVKGHTYDDAHRVPLVMRWPAGIKNPGRRVKDFVGAIDFAPTFLDLLDVDSAARRMAPITGVSLADLLNGESKHARPHVIIGRERNDVFARPGTLHGLGYPARGIRMGDLLYIRNFEPSRWPCGDPDLGLKDTDASPTKSLIIDLGKGDPFWEHSFGLRPEEQLFDVAADPDCIKNLAADPARSADRDRLRDALMAELKRQADPRVLGQGDEFDRHPSAKKYVEGWEKGATDPDEAKKKAGGKKKAPAGGK
jgi:N-sulfoglucosamine sulfohydrolase